MSAGSPSKRDAFLEADWDVISLKLVKYAVYKVRRLQWKTGEFLPKGFLPEDLALEAIRKTCEGVMAGELGEGGETAKAGRGGPIKGLRIWDPEKEPDLLDFLKGVVDSDVNGLVESAEHRLTQYSAKLSAAEAQQKAVQLIDSGSAEMLDVAHVKTAEEALLAREKVLADENRLNALLTDLKAMCADDEEELLVLLAYGEAAKKHTKIKPQLIAKYSGLPVRTTRNAMRRLARKVERKRF